MSTSAASSEKAAADFVATALANPNNAALLERLAVLDLPDCHLVAGCLFQTVWNARSNRPPTHGIADYDVFYFDAGDLSFAAEDAAIRMVRAATDDLGLAVDVKNQARVHRWYEARFEHPRAPLRSSADGIGRFLVACTCVGIWARDRRLVAPFGLADLCAGLLRPNPASGSSPAAFRDRAESYRRRWPWLRIAQDA